MYKYIQKMNDAININGKKEIFTKCIYDIIPTIKFDNKIKKIDFLNPFQKTAVLKGNKIVTSVYSNIIIYFNNNTKMIFYVIRALSFGSNGIIYLYGATEPTQLYFVGKYARINGDGLYDDFYIFNEIKKSNIPENILVSCYAYLKNPNVLLMEHMNTDLNDIIRKKLSNLCILKLMVELFDMIKCLIDYKFYYTDLKPSNILVRYDHGDKITVLLGDFGSISSENSGNAIATYPSIYYEMDKNFNGPTGVIKNPNSSHVIWSLGVTFFNLLNDGFINNATKVLWHSNIKIHKKFYINNIISLYGDSILQKSYMCNNFKLCQTYDKMINLLFREMENAYREKVKIYYQEYICVCSKHFIDNVSTFDNIKNNLKNIFDIIFSNINTNETIGQLNYQFALLKSTICI